jgi:hypothetical protein
MELKEVGSKSVGLIDLAYDRDMWRAFVKEVMNV